MPSIEAAAIRKVLDSRGEATVEVDVVVDGVVGRAAAPSGGRGGRGRRAVPRGRGGPPDRSRRDRAEGRGPAPARDRWHARLPPPRRQRRDRDPPPRPPPRGRRPPPSGSPCTGTSGARSRTASRTRWGT